MSLLAMPFLVVNYGSEMIYILEQRLHSQQIKHEKAQKVIHDLTRALFGETFFSELLRPQKLYTLEQTMEVCDKLSQSSIMKLSADSMLKLFDLVVMGVKYQMMSVRHPCELIDITLNHIDYIADLVQQSATSSELMAKARAAFVQFAKELCVAEYAQIRQSLLAFVLHKRVKVSLFLQEKLQHTDGRFVIKPGGPLPNEALVQEPGTIRYENGTVEHFEYPLASELQPRLTGNPYDKTTRECTLGQNLYTIDRTKKKAEPSKNPQPVEHGTAGSKSKISEVKPSVARPMSAGTAELNALSNLLGVSTSRPSTANSFRVNLFEQAESDNSGGGTETICIPSMTREDLMKYNKELVEVMSGLDIAQGETSAEDLADLYDRVVDGA